MTTSAKQGAGVDAQLRSALKLLSVAEDGDEYIIGRSDVGIYVAVPRPGVVLVEALRDGMSMAEAGRLASDAAGEEVDVADFLTGLHEVGLLSDVPNPDVVGARLNWVERIPQRLVKPFFGRVAWVFYALVTLGVIALLIIRPDIMPIFDDVWFLTDPIWSVLAIMAISVVITFGHESWHWLAGRALGIPARFRVSRRGIFLVFETDLSQLVTLPRKARYSPMLAGFAFDFVILGIALAMRLAFREEVLHYPPALDRFFGAVVFRQLIVLVWQVCGIAFRTDAYAIVANLLGCHNLYRATSLTAKYRLRRLDAAEAQELASMGPRDRAAANWFWLVHLGGIALMFTVLVTYLAPFAFGMIVWVGPNLTDLAFDTLAFWQSLGLTLVLLGQFAALPLIGRRERRASGKPPAGPKRTVRSRHALAWQAMAAVVAIGAVLHAGDKLSRFVEASSDATRDNEIATAHDTSCLPGEQIRILDFPHISQKAAADVVYNSHPATSGPHYGAAVAPGIYRTHLPDGQTVHALEHGRVVIHYHPGTSPDVVDKLESIAKRFYRDTVVHPNPNLDTQIALTTWGRISKLDAFDEARIVEFVDNLRGRYDHHAVGGAAC